MIGDAQKTIYQLLAGGNKAAAWYSAALGCVFFGFFYDDNLFYFLFAGIYLSYFLIRNKVEVDWFNTLFFWLFLGFVAIILVANLGRIFDGSISAFDGRDWRVTFHPMICLMLLDASYTFSRHYKIEISNIAVPVIVGIILGTLSFVFFGQEKTVAELLTFGAGRSSGIVHRNFNLADDIYFFLTCSMAGMLLFFSARRWILIATAAVCAILALYFLMMVVEGQSRAGWLGVLAGIGVTLVFGLFHKRYVLPIVMIGGAVLIGYLQYDNITARVLKEQAIYEDMWLQFKETGKVDVTKLDENSGMSTHHRLQGYENAWALLKDSPWVGQGHFDAERLKDKVPFGENLVFIVHSHNIITDVAIRQGVGVGLVYVVLLVFPIVLCGWLCSKSSARDPALYSFSAILMAYAIYVLVENMVDLSYIRSDPGVRIQYLYYSFLGLALARLVHREEHV